MDANLMLKQFAEAAAGKMPEGRHYEQPAAVPASDADVIVYVQNGIVSNVEARSGLKVLVIDNDTDSDETLTVTYLGRN